MVETNTSSKSDIITFDALFELLRNEKAKEELVKTNPLIYWQIINYLRSKLELYKNLKSNEEEAEKIKIQINNARKLIKEWYERRERKLVSLAIAKSLLKNVEESNLLPEEVPMLDELTQILEKYRKAILLNLVNLKMPSLNEEKKQEKENSYQEKKDINDEIKNDKKEELTQNIKDIKVKDIKESKGQEAKEDTKNNIKQYSRDVIEKDEIEKNKIFTTEDRPQKESQKIRLRIFEDIPKFLGTNLEIYGPFKANDIIELPYELAEVILKRKKGEEVG